VLVYQDEGTFYRQPTQAWLWAGMGRQQPRMAYSHRANTRMRVVGYLDAVGGSVLVEDTSCVTAAWLARNVRKLSRHYSGAQHIYLVWDNWPVHNHPKVQAALAEDARVRVLPLPTYAPWLNPIEKTWRWARQRVAHTHPWSDDFGIFKQQVRDEFARLAVGSLEHLRYVGLSN
jgi:transposase